MIRLAPASGLHTVTFQLAVKRGDADAQQAGGLGLVAFGVFEYPEDVVPFEGVERHRVGYGAVARRGMEFGGEAADGKGIAYKEGVYMGFMGPCYETAAEIRAFAGMGADAVGMSTVPETMVCNYMGMKVLAVSCITNMATGIQTVKHSHARVLEIANQAGDTLCRWLGAVIQRME